MNHKIQLALQSLKGLSIGDAFGESFFGETTMVLQHLQQQQVPPSSWEFTDDTVMAIAIYQQLEQYGAIEQDELVQRFIQLHDLDPNRGYDATARRLLREISEGKPWQTAASEAFDGMGSMGNGAAMRVSPIGAYLHEQNFEAIKQAAVRPR